MFCLLLLTETHGRRVAIKNCWSHFGSIFIICDSRNEIIITGQVAEVYYSCQRSHSHIFTEITQFAASGRQHAQEDAINVRLPQVSTLKPWDMSGMKIFGKDKEGSICVGGSLARGVLCSRQEIFETFIAQINARRNLLLYLCLANDEPLVSQIIQPASWQLAYKTHKSR